ncbi:hypothetical protein MD484_g1251, partial [Candolleomyces efflorescens]
MFSFRRKSKKAASEPAIRTSPSLPTLNSQGIPWPEDLVDITAIREVPPEVEEEEKQHGGAKVSLQADRTPIPFHKPFRPSESSTRPQDNGAGSISALYMKTGGPPAFEPKRTSTTASLAGRYSQRRARIPPTFNLMVAGAATVDQKAALESFLKGTAKATQAIQTACVEISESRFDRILFSVIDTPGLDFQEGRELKLDRQVSSIIKYLDAQYADTMSEESKVVRQSKGDQHVHICIYMIDPASVTTAGERQPQIGLPTKTRSEATVSQSTVPDLVPDTSSDDDSDHDEEEEDQDTLTMSPAEIRVIRRISARANILPVIAHSDSLTDEKLQAVKKAVLMGLAQAGVNLGVFAPPGSPTPDPESTPKRKTKFATPKPPTEDDDANGEAPTQSENGHASNGDPAPNSPEIKAEGEEGSEEERVSRPVVKLRSRHGRPVSRSRSRRRELSQVVEDDRRPVSPDVGDLDSVANVRFSAHIVAKTDVASLLPFALIAPEPGRRRQKSVASPAASERVPTPNPSQSESEGVETVPQTPASVKSLKNVPFLSGPPEDLKGVFIRKYRWGTIDVLDPNHCDYAAMRTAILSTHLKLLKIRTKEVLYEKYRTEKLLARRATAQISEEQRQRLLEDLGL